MAKKKRPQRRKAKQQRKGAPTAPRPATGSTREHVDDRRSVVVEATGMDGVAFDEPHVMVLIEPIRLPSGDDLYFQSPFVVPFYLLKSKKLRDAAEPRAGSRRSRIPSARTTERFGRLTPSARLTRSKTSCWR
jgi:hypothetical protein